jgi:hypothetical protein
MTSETPHDIDIYGFPDDEDTAQMLWWMGEDYVRFVVDSLCEGLLNQDASSDVIAIKCQERPQFLTAVQGSTGTVTRMSAIFRLQVLVRDGDESDWRLYVIAHFLANNLEEPATATVECHVDIDREEPA